MALIAYHHYQIDALTAGDQTGIYLMILMKTTPQTPDTHTKQRENGENGTIILFRPLAEVISICYRGRVLLGSHRGPPTV
jgi:hypothetical protein